VKQSSTIRGTGTTTYQEPTGHILGAGIGRGGGKFTTFSAVQNSLCVLVLHEGHDFGHAKHSARDSMPTGKTQEDTNQLHRPFSFHTSAT